MQIVMQVSMDGLRLNMAKDVEKLKQVVVDILSNESFDAEELQDAMNDVICNTNVLCSVYDDEKDDMNAIVEECHIEIMEVM